MGRVVVVGLGPGDADLMTVGTMDAIAAASHRFVRTARHPAAAAVPDARSFDDVYEQASSLDEVYTSIVDRLVAAAASHGEVLYAVPGSPAVAERTVDLLRARDDVEVVVLPALSFADLAWIRLEVDPVADGVRLVDGHRFAVEAAGSTGPLLVGQCDSRQVLSDIKLAAGGGEVTVLQRLGLPDEQVTQVAWDELDRSFEPDHLTSLYMPSLAAPVAAELVALDEVTRTLRERCPWDVEQTHETLKRYVLEEAQEVAEAIDSGDPVKLEEELGDLLYQVYFHATLGAEEGDYTLADVARGIREKLVRRHPHVFGDEHAETKADVAAIWERVKAEERKT
ncbi:MAG: tetrapyrrole methylase family protein / MazG family protein [Actinomycetota bacterium]|jgi:tetrapyrrole methylase family protein/MazG family protein